ncbi:uncharacterized protein LOC127856434 [Dreissena polymorpha]|uniref:Serine protease n=1 Tax=Dreissena polymorpha TaxID=45954 RepID=A0A9D4CB38_DREPO|nr:uncharacterized protein LOC127856434 [Dreissena polymorpha]KAH3720315.1 hypothetical protein DPMN_063212 [Dreissena polymorpha]
MRMSLLKILAITIFAVKVCESINVFNVPNKCNTNAPFYRQCHSNYTMESLTQKFICHGDVAYSWCEIFDLICAHALPTNVSMVVTNPACTGVIHLVNATTHRPPTVPVLTEFEKHFYEVAQHGIDDLLYAANNTGATVDEMKYIFTKQDHVNKSYVRNTKCWAYPLDLTAISPWNSNGGIMKAGVLISPRHAIWVRHFDMPVNTTLRFVDRHNNVVDRSIIRTQAIPANGSFLYGYDVVVGELDSNVPSTISFAKVMPRNLTDIRPISPTYLPAMDTDFEEKALVADMSYEGNNMVQLTTPSPSSIRNLFYEPKIGGDSGNPVFLVINHQLVLMFMFTFGDSGSGTSITAHFDDINNILSHWGSAYRLAEVDLSGFAGAEHVNIPSIIG